VEIRGGVGEISIPIIEALHTTEPPEYTGPTKSRQELSGAVRNRPDSDRSRLELDAARVSRDSNPCQTVPIPSAVAALSVVTVGCLFQKATENTLLNGVIINK